jgi:hypothetical protein
MDEADNTLWNDAEEHVIVSGEHFEVGYKCQG